MNTTIITGRLTKDAILGQTRNGTAVAKFTIASDKTRRKGRYGDDPESNFIPVEIYGKKAEALGEYLKRGTPLHLVGAIQTSSYKGEDGTTKYAWRVVGDKAEFLPSDGKMSGMNKTIITGRLVADAKTSFTPDGMCIQELSIACDRRDKDKSTDFIKVTLYGKLGESLGRFLVKGKSVTVDGKLDTGSFKNSEGTTVYTWKVIADEIYLNGGKKKQEETDAPAEVAENNSFEETGFVELPPEFDEEYFDDEF